MATVSPTARTLEACRERGWPVDVVERWVPMPGGRRRRDLFGCIDIVALDGLPGVLAIQATSGSNVSARVKKIEANDIAPRWLAAGNRIQVWGWRKYAKPLPGERTLWRPFVVPICWEDVFESGGQPR